MVIDKKSSKMWKFVEVHYVEVRFVGMVSVVSIISSHLTTESPIILPTYLTILQLHVTEFQI